MIIAVLFLELNTINRITPDYRVLGSGSDANNVASTEFPFMETDYTFPNLNLALFGENIFKISSNFSITPGFRFEKMNTTEGYYRKKIKT
jgi:outer membrane receptor protein involved in Fe transport